VDTSELFARTIRVDPAMQPTADARSRAAARLDAAIAASRPRRRLRRSVLIPALSALALAMAFTAADAFRLHLFASGHGPPAPVGVADEFRMMHLGLDLSTVTAAGTFSSPDGRITVYLARSADSTVVATAYTTSAGRVITAMGYEPDPGTGPPTRLALSSNFVGNLFPTTWQIWGLAPADAVRIEVRAADGSSLAVPLHDGMFAYLVGGDRCASGHQPVDVVALGADGREIDHADPQVAPGC
jgi:hypothetical protein